MASVQEMKDALKAESDRMVELSEMSIQSISGLLSLSTYVLTILAVILAFVGIVGWVTLHRAAVVRVEAMAKKRLDSYIDGEQFNKRIDSAIDAAFNKRWESTTVGPILDKSDSDGTKAFPAPKEKGGKDDTA